MILIKYVIYVIVGSFSLQYCSFDWIVPYYTVFFSEKNVYNINKILMQRCETSEAVCVSSSDHAGDKCSMFHDYTLFSFYSALAMKTDD